MIPATYLMQKEFYLYRMSTQDFNYPWIALNLIVVLKSIEKAVNFEGDLKNYQLFMKKITYDGKLVSRAFIEN